MHHLKYKLNSQKSYLSKLFLILMISFNSILAQEIIFTFTNNTTNNCTASDLVTDGTYLYGTTFNGNFNSNGTLFKVKLDGTGFQNLYQFSSNIAKNPTNILLVGDTIFGTTLTGGNYDFGTIYRVKTDGSNFSVLHHFGSIPNDHGGSKSNLIYNNGILYGTSYFGGSNWDVFGSFKCGYIFKLNTNGSNYGFVHEFNFNNSYNPKSCIVLANNKLFGYCDGAGGSANNFPNKIYEFGISTNTYSCPVGSFTFNNIGNNGLTNYQNSIYCLGYVPGPNNVIIKKINIINSTNSNIFDFATTTLTLATIDNLVLHNNFLFGATNAGIFRVDTLGQNYSLISNYIINRKLIFSGNSAYGVSYNSTFPNGFIFKIDLLTVNLVENASNFSRNETHFFPNPTNDKLTILSKEFNIEKQMFLVYDVNGRIIHSETINKTRTEFNTQLIKEGIYFLMLKDENRILINQKLIIKH